MKHLCITYCMKNNQETAETCITLPMTDEIASDILLHGEKSEHLCMMRNGEVYRLLRSLSEIQGYTFESAYHFEEAHL